MNPAIPKQTPGDVGEDAAVGRREAKPRTAEEAQLISKVLRHVIPLSVIGLFVSFIDRTNISVAGPDMEHAIGLTPETFGLASGLFFIAYLIFEIPSNLALKKYGAKVWIARIMITWGLVCVATALVKTPASLYVMRLLLGLAESGFYPGILFYLGLFVPARELTKAYALYQLGIPISLALGSMLTAAILLMDGFLGVAGWQWVFILEGGLAVVVGVICYIVMASHPGSAKWLTKVEAAALNELVNRDRKADDDEDAHGMKAVSLVFRNKQVWYYSVVYTFMMLGFYSVTYWLPQIIKHKFSLTNVQSGLLASIPWLTATVALFVVSWYVSKHGHRARVLTIVLVTCAVGMLASSLSSNAAVAFAGLCLGACIQAAVPLLYSFPSQHFPGAKGAVALALVNSIGQIGGFFGPYILGILRGATGSDTTGLLLLGSSFLLAALMSLGLSRQLRKSPAYVAGIE
ncbi:MULTISPECIES: MFS transporter [unclassified Caballeronia]|uniref:MFS transporter n=1 Tax=unclassified Caballeronia TaxID=2646786 RepID=UPI002028063E|nr:MULTISPECIES: MFS transporter [unclassified Caballeronia]MDR5765849.1 MFS transporter [Caballeronia sp. LZ028]